MLVIAVLEIFAGTDFFNRTEYFEDQNAMMGDDGAATFADDVRMPHFFGVTDIGDIINYVVGIFLERIIGGTVEGGAAAIVIDAQAAADIYELDLETHFAKLGVKARGFLDGPFDDENIRHLRADMEVEQL